MANNSNSRGDGEVFIGRTSPASTNLTIVGQQHVSVLSKLATITNGHPAPNGSTLGVGVLDLGMFIFRAQPHTNALNGLNRATLKSMMLTVSSQNVSIDAASLRLYEVQNSSNQTECIARDLNTGASLTGTINDNFLVDCSNLTMSPANTSIDQGTTRTFALRGVVINNKVDGSTASLLQVSLQFFSIPGLNYGYNASHLEWIDQDAGTNTSGTFQWVESPTDQVNSTLFRA